jgi:hypothetical protein
MNRVDFQIHVLLNKQQCVTTEGFLLTDQQLLLTEQQLMPAWLRIFGG